MTTKQILTAATFATAALMLSPTQATALAADGATKHERQRGVVMECHGDLDGTAVWASLYENSLYGNHLQVVLGDPDDGNGHSKVVGREILQGGKVRASLTIDGAKATIRGTATKVGRKSRVREEIVDAGYQIVSVGTHRDLRTDLAFVYDGLGTRLTCDAAFTYDLKVTKTPVA